MADSPVEIRRAGPGDAYLTVATGLWQEDWARERGAPYAVVTAFAANPTAIRLDEKHGFGSHTVTLRAPL